MVEHLLNLTHFQKSTIIINDDSTRLSVRACMFASPPSQRGWPVSQDLEHDVRMEKKVQKLEHTMLQGMEQKFHALQVQHQGSAVRQLNMGVLQLQIGMTKRVAST